MTPDEAGSGGGMRYITEEPCADMVAQGRRYSCLAACARQLLREAGVEASEDDLCDEIGYSESQGMRAGPTAQALTDRHPNSCFDGGPVTPEDLPALARRAPFIALLKTDYGDRHAVLVDEVTDEEVRVRDPWGVRGIGSECGTWATLSREDFHRAWLRAYHNVVFRTSQKT